MNILSLQVNRKNHFQSNVSKATVPLAAYINVLIFEYFKESGRVTKRKILMVELNQRPSFLVRSQEIQVIQYLIVTNIDIAFGTTCAVMILPTGNGCWLCCILEAVAVRLLVTTAYPVCITLLSLLLVVFDGISYYFFMLHDND